MVAGFPRSANHDKIMVGLMIKMEDATEKMITRHLDKGMSLRTAAYALALKRIGEANDALEVSNFFSPIVIKE
jgi:glutamate dehydrogenase/leucine dehydrogenase